MRSVPGYPKYTIDKTGLIRSKRGRVKSSIGFAGHPVVTVYGKKSKRKKLFIYLIMAEVFLDYRPGTGDVVQHIDGNVQNVHLSNLQLTNRHEVALRTRTSDLPVGIVRDRGLFKVTTWQDNRKVTIGTYGSLRRAIRKKQEYEEKHNL
jgi:hypothetical protein